MKFLQKFSLKLKLTLLFGLIFTLLLTGFSFILYKQFSQIESNEFDKNLYNYAVDVADSLDIDSYGDVEFDPHILKLSEKIFPFALGTSYIFIMDINGKVLARSNNATDDHIRPVTEHKLENFFKRGVSYDNFNFQGVPHRVIQYLLPVLKIDTPLVLQISVPMTTIVNTNKSFIEFFLISIPILMFLSAILGYFFVKKALHPMMEIISKTKKIEVGSLEDRVPVPGADDEIKQLADTINHLLSRLQVSFQSQERFIQDASHQLKTPLAIMKGELEIFRSIQRSEKENTQFYDSLSQEINFLAKLTSDLLILASVESGTTKIDFTDNRVDEIIVTQVSRLSKLAAQRNISMQLDFDSFENVSDKELSIKCDPDMLGVLFYNLIENAIKYSPSLSTIQIIGQFVENHLTVKITDEGSGIENDQLEKVFDRFFRNTASGKRIMGSGLGLAICKVVADSIDAKLWVVNNKGPGASFFLQFKEHSVTHA
jgi:signal transduction histidine kinase